MTVSEQITAVLLQMIAMDGEASFRRSDIAEQIGCVPSQINYVLSSKFRPELGYLVESRRGGGGYIRISRIPLESARATTLLQLASNLPDAIDLKFCRELIASLHQRDLLTKTEGQLLLSSLSDQALKKVRPGERDILRSDILRAALPILASAD